MGVIRNYDTLTTSPARFLGHLIPDLIAAAATAGTAAAATRTAEATARAAKAAEVAAKATARNAAIDTGEQAATTAAANTGADAQALLASIGQEGKTAGVLNIDGDLTPLVSGKSSLGNYAASGHVEGQAALIMREQIMREQGVSRAELLMDNPNGICGYCTSQVPTLLSSGAELTVRTPLGTVPPSSRWFNGRTFLGNAADPKGWP